MPKFEFSAKIPSPPEKLIEVATDFERLGRFFQYLQDIKILNSNENETTTEETIQFTFHKLSHTIVQKTITRKIDDNKLESEIISGPLKGSKVLTIFEKHEQGSKINVDADLKISLKYKFLGSIISQRIKMATIAFFYKMHTIISETT